MIFFLKKTENIQKNNLQFAPKKRMTMLTMKVKVHLMKARHLHRLVRLQHPRQVVAVVQKMKWLIEAK